MSDADRVMQFLESAGSEGCCDDCVMTRTGLEPRSRVSRVCRALAEEGRIRRRRGRCALGDHTKVLNTPAAAASGATDIEGAWRYVDRFCRAMWSRHRTDEVPPSLADIITTLRDDELIPAHVANMMHTIRSLRNMVVHENPDFSDHETTIALAAWEIIRSWASRRETEAWQLTLSMCSARAA